MIGFLEGDYGDFGLHSYAHQHAHFTYAGVHIQRFIAFSIIAAPVGMDEACRRDGVTEKGDGGLHGVGMTRKGEVYVR